MGEQATRSGRVKDYSLLTLGEQNLPELPGNRGRAKLDRSLRALAELDLEGEPFRTKLMLFPKEVQTTKLNYFSNEDASIITHI